MEIIVSKVKIVDANYPEGASKIFCDLSFAEDLWSAKTKSKDVASEVLWDYNTEEYGDKDSTLDETDNGEKKQFNHQMRFKGQFGAISTENLLVVCMIENADTPNALMGSGHGKLVNLDECSNFKDEKGNHKPELPVDGSSPEPSPRPVPTGKLHHNMMILNSALKLIGKTMAYVDLDENRSIAEVSQSAKSGKSQSTTHSAYSNNKPKEKIMHEGD